MSIKFVLAISLFCCVFLAPIYCQSQEFDDKQFREAKERDKYKSPVPLPTRRPQVQQPDYPRNLQQDRRNMQEDHQRNQNNRPQNNRQSEPIYYYPTYERQQPEQHSNCICNQNMISLEQRMMNSLAANIPDRRKPSHF